MYAVQFRRFYNSVDDGEIVAAGFRTVEEAAKARYLSGDLVVHARTLQVVKDTSWLWDWEKADPKCYAQKAIDDAPLLLPP